MKTLPKIELGRARQLYVEESSVKVADDRTRLSNRSKQVPALKALQVSGMVLNILVRCPRVKFCHYFSECNMNNEGFARSDVTLRACKLSGLDATAGKASYWFRDMFLIQIHLVVN